MHGLDIRTVEERIQLAARLRRLDDVVEFFLCDDLFLNQHTPERAKAERT